MTYQEATEYLYTQVSMFQMVGASAYKPGLDTSLELDRLFGNCHNKFRSIHIAGTNGKGSTAHTLAAILQSAGYKTGLYTSPHLVDFRERIRVDGRMISQEAVVDFVSRYRKMLDCGEVKCQRPSFFELTMVMAFEYFAAEGVDVAVIETGLGGRLDSTNIITPELCVITNISFDHMQFLGNTLEAIASEKAGIIKKDIPVVVGEAGGASVRKVFVDRADSVGAPIVFASDCQCYEKALPDGDRIVYTNTHYGNIIGQLTGDCQKLNTATILTAITELAKRNFTFSAKDVANGFANVCQLTGLAGRWMKVADKPLTICDTGHNEGGWQYISAQLKRHQGGRRMILGFVSDKDVAHILDLMPDNNTTYYFTRASVERAMDQNRLAELAFSHGLKGVAYSTVSEAYEAALAESSPEDLIFIGGSTFVVADFLKNYS
ncbi:MAG: bifunctional folylpolyglutamate synthase/dihydrofolate synthase [Muribaculum sp.]|nr:bifunctional folylpolyglutamate synthase/dihydrofolate synthase [Muribaculaceae bacterium]MCM1080628.1 bifunctional folylpolyglutamate synthase/dihydrofolate synthase [Muribaculum sp.]